MRKYFIILLFIIAINNIFANTDINNTNTPVKYFSMTVSENSSFLGVKLDFIGNRVSNNNIVLNMGLGVFLYNSQWGLAYFSTPLEFLYRKKIDDSMFFDVGISADALMDRDINFYLTLSPVIGIGLTLRNVKQNFIKTLKFSMAYNMKKYTNQIYYPSGVSLRYDIGF